MKASIEDDLKSLPVLAAIRYWWWWASHDLAYLRRIARGGGLDADLVRAISKEYGVARGIRRENDDPDGEINLRRAQRIADEVNNRYTDLAKSEDMSKRFDVCLAIVGHLRSRSETEEAITPNDFVSGISKLSWFVAPKGWTMFDRLAAQALGIKSGSARDKAKRFYEQLESSQFVELTGRMNAALQRDGIAEEHFHAERIVDQYLWLSAIKDEALALLREKTAAFLGAIGDEKSSRLLRMGKIIEDEYTTDLAKFIPEQRKTNEKSK